MVIVRRWRQQGPVRRPSVWTPVGVVDDIRLAAEMADLVQEPEAGIEASVVSADELLHTFPAEDRERILGLLNSRTTHDIRRESALRLDAEARLGTRERRSAPDRRSGRERRSGVGRIPPEGERRSGRDRRSGLERRAATAA